MKITKLNIEESIHDIVFCDRSMRSIAITAAISSRDITKDMVRVKSSNIWSYNINIRNNDNVGDVYVQFKSSRGGPGDIYVYYDVPVRTYRRWHSAPSKGHFLWQEIRGKFRFAKLTGDKKTKQPGGVDYDYRNREEPQES